MQILAPPQLSAVYPIDTGLQVARRGQPLILGPVQYDIEYHPLIPMFLTLGKLIHLRRLAWPETPNADPGYEQAYRQWLTSYADQIVTGDAEDFEHHVGETRGVQLVIERVVGQLRGLAERCDDLALKLFEGQVADDLYLDPGDELPARVDQLIGYMEANEIGLENRAAGYRDYLMELLTTGDGLPAAFPTSVNPRVLDAWIDDAVIAASSFAPAE